VSCGALQGSLRPYPSAALVHYAWDLTLLLHIVLKCDESSRRTTLLQARPLARSIRRQALGVVIDSMEYPWRR
jgi:hypothetical protein